MTQPTQSVESPYFFIDPKGRYTLTLLSNEDPHAVGRGGAWNYFPSRPFLSYFCWMFGGHQFVEHMREYHHDSSETAHTLCLRCKLELAQYREMAAFSQFASDLDAATQRLLARGSRLTELLKQPQFSPVPVEEQVVAIFAGTRGYLDRVDVAEIGRFEQSMLTDLRAKGPQLLDAIREEREISDTTEKGLTEFFDGFARTFA